MRALSEFADDYVATFNNCVASGDYSRLLAMFGDDAVVRFENVPPNGTHLEFAGRPAYTAAYEQQPPDDRIDVTSEPREEEGEVVVEFAWQSDHSPGTMRLTVDGDDQISKLVVVFGAPSPSTHVAPD
jgi:ketosteroid isomerase-like protein